MTAVDVVLAVLRLGIGCWLMWSVPRVRHADPADPAGRPGRVSVVIPARDESGSIGALLSSLPSGVEVVVVDDHSTDTTAAEARSAGARVVAAPPVPPGWVGKSWACAHGVDATEGEVVAFVDADVRFGPGGFAAVLAEHHRRGGLVSVQPFHEPGRWAETWASIFNIVGFAATDAASPWGRRAGARGAFGPVLVTSRADHHAVGGHEAVRSSIVDDVALADVYRRAGLPVAVLAGGDAVRFRMYPAGLRAMVEGFTKNLAAGAAAVRRSTVVLVVAWMTVVVQAAAAPVVAAVQGSSPAWAAALYLAVAAQLWWMARRVGRFGPVLALAFPVSVVLFLVVFARSVWATATGTVRWRGRSVPTRGR